MSSSPSFEAEKRCESVEFSEETWEENADEDNEAKAGDVDDDDDDSSELGSADEEELADCRCCVRPSSSA